jgi:hypothetical protein
MRGDQLHRVCYRKAGDAGTMVDPGKLAEFPVFLLAECSEAGGWRTL